VTCSLAAVVSAALQYYTIILEHAKKNIAGGIGGFFSHTPECACIAQAALNLAACYLRVLGWPSA
jgi:hypothetical protein